MENLILLALFIGLGCLVLGLLAMVAEYSQRFASLWREGRDVEPKSFYAHARGLKHEGEAAQRSK